MNNHVAVVVPAHNEERTIAEVILYIGLLIAFYLIFRIHLTLERLEQEITEIVRTVALERMKELSTCKELTHWLRMN